MERISQRGIKFSRIGLGCVTFGREINEAQSFRILDYAFERGINLLDTAEAYGPGHASEKIVGQWIRATGLRREVVVQTKVTRGYTRPHLREALEASLERLRTDCVDFYLFHSYDKTVAMEEAAAGMQEALDTGKVKAAGCSNFPVEALREMAGLIRIDMLQPVYNLVRREIEAEILPLARENGIAVVTYSPLGAGFLAGKYAAGAELPSGTRFDVIPGHKNEYFSERNFETVEKLRALAERTGIAMVKLAMAWALKNRDVSGVLIGARKTSHIDNALEALDVGVPVELLLEMGAWA